MQLKNFLCILLFFTTFDNTTTNTLVVPSPVNEYFTILLNGGAWPPKFIRLNQKTMKETYGDNYALASFLAGLVVLSAWTTIMFVPIGLYKIVKNYNYTIDPFGTESVWPQYYKGLMCLAIGISAGVLGKLILEKLHKLEN